MLTMTTPEMMIERIDRLERENHRLAHRRSQSRRRVLALAASISTVVLVSTGLQKGPKTIEAERFILRDNDGRMRAEQVIKEGSVSQTFFDKSGKPRLLTGIDDNGTMGIYLFSEKDKLRLGLSLDADGEASLLGYGKDDDKPRFTLSVQPNGLPFLSLIDKNAKQRVGLGITPENSPQLSISDGNGNLLFFAPEPKFKGDGNKDK